MRGKGKPSDALGSTPWVGHLRTATRVVGHLVLYLALTCALAYLGAELGSRYADAKHVDAVPSGFSSNDSGESWWYVAWGGLAGLMLGLVLAVTLVLARRRRRRGSPH